MAQRKSKVSPSWSFYLVARKHVVKRKQFLLYAAIGVSGVILDYIIYALGIKVVGLGVLAANFLSVSIGIINNFILNTKYNFKTHDRLLARFGLFYTIGFLGLILSDVLLIFFTDGFHFGALVAKLLTLPFVLLGQYFLNKKLSFGSIDESISFLKYWGRHWPGYVVVAIFIFSSVLFVKFIPANFSYSPPETAAKYAPDEGRHYVYNVAFILNNHRLPTSGKDDLAAYKTCHSNDIVLVPCIYSYTVFPGPSYIVSATSAKLLSKTFHTTPQVAARFPSVMYGAIFALSIYFSAYLLTRRRLIATIITIGICLIPQYIFTSSYTNLDAHSIAISGLLGLAFVLFLQAPRRPKRQILLAITACGLLPIAKYNFMFLFIPALLLVIYNFRNKLIEKADVVRMAAWGAGSFLVLPAFWYIRNLILYHDLFGQSFAIHEMSKYHALGHSLPFNISSFVTLTDKGFFNLLFSSFYVAYGQMAYFLDSFHYVVPAILNLIGAVYLVNHLATNKRIKPLVWAAVAYVAIFVITFCQVYYNSMHYDFQPQGRYMFPILAPTALFLAYAYRIDKRMAMLSFLTATGTLYMYLYGMEYFVRLYMNI